MLALLPDLDNQEIGLGEYPIATLLRFAAGREPVLVIDQLDQAFFFDNPHLRRRCREWLRRARESGIRVVAGCRTVDAAQDTQLHHMLAGEGEIPQGIAVGDFAEAAVAGVLAPTGRCLGRRSGSTLSLPR